MSRSRLPLLLALAIAVVAFGGFLVAQRFLAGDNVTRLTLPPSATPSPALASSNSTPTGGSASRAPASGGPIASITATPAGLAGTWSIGDGSLVGYRVREQLGGVSALTDAVGRTSAVTGSATLAASADSVRVTTGSFSADVTRLASDDGRRDNRIRSMGIESDTYPTATFQLTQAVDVPASALTGATVDVRLTGDLTIHGVTKSVTLAGQAQLSGNRIQVAASVTFPFSAFGMTPPNMGGFVQVQNDATLEVLLSLTKD